MTAARAVGALAATLAASAAFAADLKVGVVNVDEIFARYRKAEDLKKAEEAKLGEVGKDIAGRSRALEKRIAEYESDPDRAGRLEDARELQLEKYVLELDIREFRRQTQLAQSRIRRRVMDEIAAVCRRIGKKEGYDLILKQYTPGRPLRSDQAQVEAFEQNAVLFAAESVDVTGRVLNVLEDAYQRGLKLVPDEAEIEPAGPPEEIE